MDEISPEEERLQDLETRAHSNNMLIALMMACNARNEPLTPQRLAELKPLLYEHFNETPMMDAVFETGEFAEEILNFAFKTSSEELTPGD